MPGRAIELTALLWREREALQAVVDRQQELAETIGAAHPDPGRTGPPEAAGDVGRAADALEDAIGRLRPIVLMRDIEVAAVAEEWDAPAGVILAELPHFAPPGPWGDILADHLRALRNVARRCADAAREIEGLLQERGISRVPGLPGSAADYEEPAAG